MVAGRVEDSMSPRTDRPKVVALVGCTGSGKTGLGVALAQWLDTEIISVDSMAVYRGMDIGTAKPTRTEQDGVVHHLLDVVNPDEPFTAADFARQARSVIERLHARGKVTVLVGGTGLYLRSLLHGIFEGPGTDVTLRNALVAQQVAAAAEGNFLYLHARLQAVDPLLAQRLHPNDHVRILRGLEVFEQTGRPLSEWQAAHRFASSPYHGVKLALELPREVLYERIDRRVEGMVARGLEAETQGLLETYGSEVKPMKGLGYLHFVRYLRGEWTLPQAITEMQTDTRHFARRQLTWFRGESGVSWVEPDLPVLQEKIRISIEL